MTIPLRFYDTTQVPAGRASPGPSPAKALALRRVMLRCLPWRPRQIQGPRPPPSLPRPCRDRLLAAFGRRCTAPGGARRSCCRPKPISAARIGFALAWGILNFFLIALLRRPALSGALSLTLVVVLVLLSRLKHDVVQMTANFVDLMVIDRDTAAYPVHDLPQSALDRGRRRDRHPAADVRAVVARSVPHPPPAGAGRQAGLSRRAGRLFHYLAG